MHSGEVRTNGVTIRLSAQPLQILLLLLERPGELITRDEIRERLWPAGTFVDFDTGLNSGVKRLREALGDSAEHPQIIETLPRRGYRLIAAVEEPQLETAHARWWKTKAALGAAILLLSVVIVGAAFRFGRPVVPRIDSIAVLPFANLSGDRQQDYFADGMTDALIAELAQLRDLRVISRTSIMQYKDSKKPLPQIARELNVDAILEGSVIRSGQKVHTTAQVIHAGTDRHLWTRTYQRDVGDVTIFERELARDVAGALRRESRPLESSGSAVRVNPQAYESYLRSHFAAGRQSVDGLMQAIAYAQDAIAKQPDFAPAHAACARFYYESAFVGPSPQDSVRKAESAARKALQLDETLPLAHIILGQVLYRFHWNWVAAEAQLRRAVELSPSDSDAHRSYSVFLVMQDRSAAAVTSAQRAIALDPLSLQARQDLGRALRAARRYDEAIDSYRKALEIEPTNPRAHYHLGRTYLVAGKATEATAALETAVKLSKRNLRYLTYLGYAYGKTGRLDDARAILQELERRSGEQYVSPMGWALVHAGLGDTRATLDLLEEAYRQRAFELTEAREFAAFEYLYADPRFQELMRRVGLPSGRS